MLVHEAPGGPCRFFDLVAELLSVGTGFRLPTVPWSLLGASATPLAASPNTAAAAAAAAAPMVLTPRTARRR